MTYILLILGGAYGALVVGALVLKPRMDPGYVGRVLRRSVSYRVLHVIIVTGIVLLIALVLFSAASEQ